MREGRDETHCPVPAALKAKSRRLCFQHRIDGPARDRYGALADLFDLHGPIQTGARSLVLECVVPSKVNADSISGFLLIYFLLRAPCAEQLRASVVRTIGHGLHEYIV
jgi:hypothetical protein